jgi:hypothetical protein
MTRHRRAGGVVAAAALAVAGGAAGFQQPKRPATITLSPATAGASHVGLTLRMPTVLRCGRPTGGAIVLTLPRAAGVPRTIGNAAVKLNGVSPAAVAVVGRAVTVSMPVVHGAICDSLVDGVLKLVIAPSAALRNPPRAGDYSVIVQQGHATYRLPVAVQA